MTTQIKQYNITTGSLDANVFSSTTVVSAIESGSLGGGGGSLPTIEQITFTDGSWANTGQTKLLYSGGNFVIYGVGYVANANVYINANLQSTNVVSANEIRVTTGSLTTNTTYDMELYNGNGTYAKKIKALLTHSLLYTLDNPNAYGTSASDQFGASVAISGNYAIVGAQQEDTSGAGNSGKAYIFNLTTGALVYTLDDPNAYSTGANDYFGGSVAISGNYCIVGAKLEDDAGGSSSGKAYIFKTTNGVWTDATLLFTLDNPNAYGTSASDQFGASVAISGNYAIVGVPLEDDAGGSSSGKAYIYDVTTGTKLFTLNNPNPYGTSAVDEFGHSVAISGNYAIVSAWYEDDASGADSGKAYIYNVTTGALVYTLNNPNAYGTSAGDNFGASVAISGNYAIVSAYGESDAGGTTSGKAYIFKTTNGVWTDTTLLYTLNNPNPYGTSASDYFGQSVSISGNYAIVSASREDDDSGTESGKAYIYNVTTGALVYTLDNPNAYGTSASDYFGESVAISGNYAIVSAIFEDDAGGTSSGKAYVYYLG